MCILENFDNQILKSDANSRKFGQKQFTKFSQVHQLSIQNFKFCLIPMKIRLNLYDYHHFHQKKTMQYILITISK